jgi:hypothetical protein
MHQVRTTMRPDDVLEVDDVELDNLRRQGLLIEETPAAEQAEQPPVEQPEAGSAKSTRKSGQGKDE